MAGSWSDTYTEVPLHTTSLTDFFPLYKQLYLWKFKQKVYLNIISAVVLSQKHWSHHHIVTGVLVKKCHRSQWLFIHVFKKKDFFILTQQIELHALHFQSHEGVPQVPSRDRQFLKIRTPTWHNPRNLNLSPCYFITKYNILIHNKTQENPNDGWHV